MHAQALLTRAFGWWGRMPGPALRPEPCESTREVATEPPPVLTALQPVLEAAPLSALLVIKRKPHLLWGRMREQRVIYRAPELSRLLTMGLRPSQCWNVQGLPWGRAWRRCWQGRASPGDAGKAGLAQEMLVKQGQPMLWFMFLLSEVHRGEAPLTHQEMPKLC